MSSSLQPHGFSSPGFPVLHYFPEFAQTHVHWCHPTISSSVALFSSCSQSFPASRSFPMSHLFASGSQSTVASASASVLPMNIQDWFPLGLTVMISLLTKGTLKSLLQHHPSKAWILRHSAFFMVKLSHLYMTTGKTIALTTRTVVGKVIPQLVLSMYSPDVSQILPLSSDFILLIFYLNNYRNLPVGLPTFILTPFHFILHKVTTRNY